MMTGSLSHFRLLRHHPQWLLSVPGHGRWGSRPLCSPLAEPPVPELLSVPTPGSFISITGPWSLQMGYSCLLPLTCSFFFLFSPPPLKYIPSYQGASHRPRGCRQWLDGAHLFCSGDFSFKGVPVSVGPHQWSIGL